MSRSPKVNSVNVSSKTDELRYFKNSLTKICLKLAQRFNLYSANGEPRKAFIIDALSGSTCLACIAQKLSASLNTRSVDDFYSECHKLAINCLIEELCRILAEMNYKVAVLSEARLEYGKADIILRITKHGINLMCETKNLLVEVKTGNSLSFSQLFRYFLDGRNDSIVIWRVRRRQVLVFNLQKIKPLLAEFVRMICLRAERLLSSEQMPSCQHAKDMSYQPSQEELQQAFEDFSEALVETLPMVLDIILKQLEMIPKQKCDR